MKRLNFYGMAALTILCLVMSIWTVKKSGTPVEGRVDVVIRDKEHRVVATQIIDPSGRRRTAQGYFGEPDDIVQFLPTLGDETLASPGKKATGPR